MDACERELSDMSCRSANERRLGLILMNIFEDYKKEDNEGALNWLSVILRYVAKELIV
jgi:hypothetical protein